MTPSELVRDFRHSLKLTLRDPARAFAPAILLAIGIAPTATMFSVVDRALFRPVNLPGVDQLVFIRAAAAPPDGDQLAWWSKARTLETLASYSAGGANISVSGQSERTDTTVVSPNFFELAKVSPTLGRGFLEEASEESIVSYRFAVAHFGDAQNALGQRINVNGLGFTVAGVMPRGFSFPRSTDVWVARPARQLPGTTSDSSLDVGSKDQVLVARLRAGATLGEARSELKLMHQRLQEAYSKSGVGFGMGATATPLKEVLSRETRPALLALSGAVLFVLLLTCANTAGLLLAQAVARQKEVAILVWLGATRGTIIRQIVSGSVILAIVGGALGILLAALGLNFFRTLPLASTTVLSDVSIDLRSLLFTLSISLAGGVLVGLAPAFQAFVPDIAETLKAQGGRSRGALRLNMRRLLVVSEVLLALVLTAGAALMAESLYRLVRVEPGFDPRDTLTAQISLPKVRYAPSRQTNMNPSSTAGLQLKDHSKTSGERSAGISLADEDVKSANARGAAFQRSLFESIGRVPGVIAAGAIDTLPLAGNDASRLAFDVAGTPQPETAEVFYVAGGYFQTMSIPLRNGRAFSDSDGADAPRVLIINETMAHRCWPGKSPVGDTLVLEGESAARQIIGVVGDVRAESLGEAPGLQIYLPWFQPFTTQQTALASLNVTLVSRVASTSQTRNLPSSVANAVASVDGGVPLFRVRPMEQIIADSAAPLRARALVLSFFAITALMLSAAGVYSVVSYLVACRTHEIGVRISLGARRGDVLLLIIREGAGMAIVGVVLGFLTSLQIAKIISGLLFGVAPSDPRTLLTVSIGLLVVAVIASVVPALRAAKLDPAVAIRYE